MQLDDINISEYFDSAIMPYGMRLTHLPSGLSVAGNCKHEQSKLKLRDTLTNQLSIFVSQWEGENKAHVRKSAAEIENEELKMRLARLEEMFMRGNGGAVGTTALPEPQAHPAPSKSIVKRREAQKPKGTHNWTPERRAAAAQRMKDRQAAKYGLNPPAESPKVDTPMGQMTEQEFVRRAMRPPTEPPQKLPRAHDSHGSTVVKKSPDVTWIKE
jgi:hypothetical protein